MKARASLCRNRKRVSSTSDGAEAFVVLAHDTAQKLKEGRDRWLRADVHRESKASLRNAATMREGNGDSKAFNPSSEGEHR